MTLIIYDNLALILFTCSVGSCSCPNQRKSELTKKEINSTTQNDVMN